MEIVFVGAGRLATQLAKALHARGEHIVAVYSRTMASASTLRSSSVSLSAALLVAVLSFTCSSVLIPERTAITSSRSRQKRTDQEAMLQSG